MAEVIASKKACTVNPLKMSQPIGGSLAFMGVNNCMPLLHGSQGCTSFGLVLFVRHFREAIPLQTTAMNEVATVLGGFENVEQAIINIANRAKPSIIGICSTGVTETKGDDVLGYIKQIRERRPELDHIALVYVSTPDYKDAFQDGWAKAVQAMVEQLVEPASDVKHPKRVNVLPGCHLTPGDIDELRDIIEAFGLQPLFFPDLSGSLDGHIPEDFTPTTLGGIGVEEIKNLGSARLTIAIGEQMRPAAKALQDKTGVPFALFDRLTGLAPNDEFLTFLADVSDKPVPVKYRRQRGQLIDAMLDGHFHIGGRNIAIGAEPDLLYSVGTFLSEQGAKISSAVTTTRSAVLEKLPCEKVLIGDLEDLETQARERDCELLITHSHGRQAADRLHIPFYRMGLPMFDRLGAAHETIVGYRGSRNLIFAIGNLFIGNAHEPDQDTWRGSTEKSHVGATLTSH